MNKLKILLLGICLIGCKHDYGFIYNYENQEPIENVEVKSINNPKIKVLTNNEGLFSFRRVNNLGDVIIEKQGYVTDTLKEYPCRRTLNCFTGRIFYMKKK